MNHAGMDAMHTGGDTDCKVSMLWNWYTTDACFLSSSWHIRNNGMFAASCIGTVLLVVMLEFLRRLGKEYDALILRQFQAELSRRAAAIEEDNMRNGKTSDDAALCCDLPAPTRATFRASPAQQAVRALVHGVTLGLAYLIMLLAMYFNGYIFFSIVIGGIVGKFFCDWLVVPVSVAAEGAAGATGAGGVGGVGGGIEEPTVCCG